MADVSHKDYTVHYCLTLMTNPDAFPKLEERQQRFFEIALEQCSQLLSAVIETQIGAQPSSFHSDAGSNRLTKALQGDPGFVNRLQQWVASNFPEGSVTLLLYGGNAAQLRQRAIQELNVP